MLTVSLSINTTGAWQNEAYQKMLMSTNLMLVINSEAINWCCVLYLQAAEPGTFAALWIKCQAAPQSVFGGPHPQVLSALFHTVPCALYLRLRPKHHARTDSMCCQYAGVALWALLLSSAVVIASTHCIQPFCYTNLQSLSFRLKHDVDKLSQQRDSINKQRKLTQEADGRALQQLDQQYKALVAKNMEISMACQELESEVNQLQEEVGHSDDSSHDT